LTESTSPGEADYAGRLIYKGAEADIIRGDWQGLDAVFKVRNPLGYRLKVMDDAIRRQRTIHEADIIHSARAAGVQAPFLYHVDVPAATLVMEFVDGDRVKDIVGAAPRDMVEGIFEDFGRSVARLHSSGIMHGDLTTANVVKRGRELVFIDFGLAVRTFKLEDHAVDLRLIKETLVGAHSPIAPYALEALFRGYTKGVGPARSRAAFKQLQNIERRGRYARVA
jgi:TP53 regulating kinase-like protein